MNLQVRQHRAPAAPHSVYKAGALRISCGKLTWRVGKTREWPPSLEGLLVTHAPPADGRGRRPLVLGNARVFCPKFFHRTHPSPGTARPSRRRAPRWEQANGGQFGSQPILRRESRGQLVTSAGYAAAGGLWNRCSGVYWCPWVAGSLSGILRRFPIWALGLRRVVIRSARAAVPSYDPRGCGSGAAPNAEGEPRGRT